MRNWSIGLALILLVAANSFAQPSVLKSSAIPEPGVLVALGTGLIGLASVVRRHLSR